MASHPPPSTTPTRALPKSVAVAEFDFDAPLVGVPPVNVVARPRRLSSSQVGLEREALERLVREGKISVEEFGRLSGGGGGG
ncbi:hypothetical protein HDU67_004124, partial [Dinochytrium kinnereticum]